MSENTDRSDIPPTKPSRKDRSSSSDKGAEHTQIIPPRTREEKHKEDKPTTSRAAESSARNPYQSLMDLDEDPRIIERKLIRKWQKEQYQIQKEIRDKLEFEKGAQHIRKKRDDSDEEFSADEFQGSESDERPLDAQKTKQKRSDSQEIRHRRAAARWKSLLRKLRARKQSS